MSSKSGEFKNITLKRTVAIIEELIPSIKNIDGSILKTLKENKLWAQFVNTNMYKNYVMYSFGKLIFYSMQIK